MIPLIPAEPDTLDAIRADYPRWRITGRYIGSTAGPGANVYQASAGGICISAWTVAGLREALAQHETGRRL